MRGRLFFGTFRVTAYRGKKGVLMIPTPALRSTHQHNFATMVPPPIQRSSFDRSFTRKTTFDAGWLVPVYAEYCFPSDTISMDATFLCRINTLLYPIMDNLYLDTFWAFAPLRILWDNWQRFNGERATPEQSIDLEIPVLTGTAGGNYQIQPFDIGDYLGLPVGINMPLGNVDDAPGISALFFRMYNRFWNDWIRDQNTQGLAFQETGDGPDAYENYVILNRGKRHDRFSSALPWPQKGTAVALPLGTTAPIIGDGQAISFWNGTSHYALNYNDSTGINGQLGVTSSGGAVGGAPAGSAPTGDAYIGINPSPLSNSHMLADLSNATSATINDLREAITVQQILELDARGGTRYVEQLWSMWRSQVPDYRLQRTEYLGGSSDMMGIHAVAQTARAEGSDMGDLAAFGQMMARSGFTYNVLEHGILMCFVNVRADLTYQQGISPMWQWQSRYDFYMPPLAHIGEQPIYNREIYYQNTSADQEVFGYQEAWSPLRYSENLVTGAFRSNFAQTLDPWHLALEFTALPELDNGFVVDNPPIDRITATQEEGNEGVQFRLDMRAKSRWARALPVYSTPGVERI